MATVSDMFRFDLNQPGEMERMQQTMRKFETGATRDTDADKLNYRRFFSPQVLKRRAEYMQKHRVQADGALRDPDNWKKGIPLEAYADSEWRHHWEFWSLLERGIVRGEDVEESICALMFNLEGYLFELLSTQKSNTVALDEQPERSVPCGER